MAPTMAPQLAEIAAAEPADSGWTVYMLCYARPIGDISRPGMWARHYVGSYKNPSRIAHHEKGTCGVAICMAFHSAGIPFVVVRTTSGGKKLERRIKNNGHHEKYCPRCTPNPRKGFWGGLEGQ
jgi:hypothetical protein